MQQDRDDARAPAASAPVSEEDRFSRMIEALPTALVLVGADGRIELMNRQAERMFGYDHAALHGKPLEVLLPERFRTGHAGQRRAFAAQPSARAMGAGLDLIGQRADGSEFPLEVQVNPIDIDGVPMVMAGVLDISARRDSDRREKEHRILHDQELVRQRLDLERSNSDLEDFAYVASHDLKAPLRAIGHLVGWIREDIEATAGAQTLENLRLLQGRVARLQMLLDGLLAYSRVGRNRVMVEPVDIAELVHDIVTLLAPPPGFVVACEGDMGVIRTHRTPIRVVLENLITNGVKHHDRAEGRVGVAIRRVDAQTVEFRVSDDGPGIAERFHERIFVIFQTLESRDDVESSGIGLAIVKKKVQAHGGTVWVESKPPARGTSFVFTWQESPA